MRNNENSKMITFKKEYANGIIKEYSKYVSPFSNDVDINNMDRLIDNYITNDKHSARQAPKVRLNMTENELKEALRQSTKNCRARAEKAANSYLYQYHTVFTSADQKINRNPRKFMSLVSQYLENHGITYFMILELNHPQNVWKFVTEYNNEAEFYKNFDSIENGYGCYNRHALAPLVGENGFHVHALTDKKVDFTKWIEKYNSDIENLYSEAFYYYESDELYVDALKKTGKQINEELEIAKLQQKRNLNYMLKYVYYTKATVPNGFHIYKTNVEVQDLNINDISAKDLITNNELEVYNKRNYDNLKNVIDKIKSDNTNIPDNIIRQLADNFYKLLLNSSDNKDNYDYIVQTFTQKCNYSDYDVILFDCDTDFNDFIDDTCADFDFYTDYDCDTDDNVGYLDVSDNLLKRTFKSSMKNKNLQSDTNRSNTECYARSISLISPRILKKFTLIHRIARKGMIFFFTRLKIPKGF